MNPSKIIFLIWMLFVAAWARGWTVTHTWLPNWVAILGLAYVILVVLEFVGIIGWQAKLPHRRTRPVTTPEQPTDQ